MLISLFLFCLFNMPLANFPTMKEFCIWLMNLILLQTLPHASYVILNSFKPIKHLLLLTYVIGFILS